MFIDIHVHTHQKRHPTIRRQEDLKSWSTPEQLVDAMDKAGINKAVVQGCASPECRYTLVTPEEAIDICREYPERLVPFCNFDPRFLLNSSESDYMPLLTAYKKWASRE